MPKNTAAPRIRRHRRVRARLAGTPERPRLAVSRSLKHISAQLIDDTAGRTILSASDRELTATRGKGKKMTKIELAQAVGKLMAEKAKTSGLTAVVFDRGGYAYHGRVAALAEGAREGGLTF